MRISDWSSGRVLFRSPAPAPATAERPAPGSGRHAEGDPAANHRVALKGGRCVPLERRGSNGDPGAGGIAMKLAYVDLCGFRGYRKRRSEEHTSELQSLMRTSYAVFCLKTQKK